MLLVGFHFIIVLHMKLTICYLLQVLIIYILQVLIIFYALLIGEISWIWTVCVPWENIGPSRNQMERQFVFPITFLSFGFPQQL